MLANKSNSLSPNRNKMINDNNMIYIFNIQFSLRKKLNTSPIDMIYYKTLFSLTQTNWQLSDKIKFSTT